MLEKLTSRKAVAAALDEFDSVGREDFLTTYGFGPSTRFFVRRDGKLYDSKAVAGVAYGYEYPEEGPLQSGAFSGGETGAKPALERLGYEVVEAEVERPTRVDRSNPAAAQAAFERLIPAEFRTDALALLVETIEEAAAVGPKAWTVTLFQTRLRINVGSVQAVWLGGKGISIAMIGDELSNEDRERLSQLGRFNSEPGTYRSIPRAIDYDFAPANAASVTEITRRARKAFILAAVHDLPTSRFQSSFSPGLLSYLREATAGDLPDPGFVEAPTDTRAWIFQASPHIYDIDRALRGRNSIQFTARQNKRRIQVGDRAYIWRAGPQAGIIATGSVSEGPSDMAPDPEENVFFLRREEFSKIEPRVNIAIDDLVEPPLLRTEIAQDEALSDLMILRFANATVFGVTKPQAARLDELVAQRQRRYWWVNQGETYTRARSGEYISAPLVDRGGTTPHHWRTMRELRAGDVVLNYSNSAIRAVSEVIEPSVETEPGDPAGEDHLKAVLRYRDLNPKIELSEIPERLRVAQGGPFNRNGGVNQGYLYPLRAQFVAHLAQTFPQLGLDAPAPFTAMTTEQPALKDITERIHAAGLRLSDALIRRYHTSLQTRGFVVPTGISGTGKTWLAETYGRAIGARLLIVPVAPNWTTNEDLLGYLNPLDQQYHDTEFSEFLRAAVAEHEQASRRGQGAQEFHLVLDEMNLARVEYYFAKFLSAMELRARSEVAQIELAPGHVVPLTPNLKFIGTVNVDETTHGFADKVYDRSQIIELTIAEADVRQHLGSQPYTEPLVVIWRALLPVAPFAFRVLDEISIYVSQSESLGVDWQTALDEQLMQKVLPKVKGTDLRLTTALQQLVDVAADMFPLTHAKASNMLGAFNEHGFTSYF